MIPFVRKVKSDLNNNIPMSTYLPVNLTSQNPDQEYHYAEVNAEIDRTHDHSENIYESVI